MSKEINLDKIKKGIDTYFKLKFFTIYIVFAAAIFYVNNNIQTSLVLMCVALLYLILLSRYKEEFIDGKEQE